MVDPVEIKIYRWGGQWGPFKVKIPCGECTLTKDVLNDVLSKELNDIPVNVETKDWLSHWWEPLGKGGWHAPIVMVEGKVISQGLALNRGLIIQAVVEAYVRKAPLEGNHIFGKESCPFCHRAKELFVQHEIEGYYHDVVEEPRSLYAMLARVKPIIGPKTPVTVPQIWLDGKYIGGCTDLEAHLSGLA